MAPLQTLSNGADNKRNISLPPKSSRMTKMTKSTDTTTSNRTRRQGDSNVVSSAAGLRAPLRLLESNEAKAASPKLGRGPLLRYGEKKETLFGFSAYEVSPAYLRDCDRLVENEDDPPAVWRRVLEYATRNQILSDGELFRLHRRAVTRLNAPFDDNQPPSQDLDDLVAIWLSFVDCLIKQGSLREARSNLLTYGSWAPQNARIFIQAAKIEKSTGNVGEAIALLEQAMKNKAQPLREVEKELASLRPATSPKRFLPTNQPASSPARRQTEFGTTQPGVKQDKLSKEGTRKQSIHFRLDPLPVRRQSGSRIEDQTKSRWGSESPTLRMAMDEDTQERKTPIPVTKYTSDTMGTTKPTGTPTLDVRETHSQKQQLNQTFSGVAKSTPTRTVADLNIRGRQKSTGSKKRPLLLQKTGLSGKAQRVDPSVNYVNDDDDDDEDNSEDSKVAIPKLDLSYIMSWEPEKFKSEKDNTPKETISKPPPQLPKIDDVMSWEPDKFNNNNQKAHDVPKETKAKPSPQLPKIDESKASLPSSRKEQREQVQQRDYNTQGLDETTIGDDAADRSKMDSSALGRLKDQANHDFLPFINEKNIMRVNNVPYMKLGGAVGKGGSCKVYRALAKDYSVVAIKKVKISGMDRKQIESFANEIMLLRSLRGSSSIIQMFDSEVDRQRKAIFVVMELGEADLNHVLQRKSLSIAGESGRTLNMNFIRLTWQQMLTAVHCIHEQRIIHGDLKPANFLFVKGSLKLIDFGIAKAIENQDTTNIYRESQIGTLNYMSPEAILDSGNSAGGDRPTMKMGRSSDIWSLGCILYQMVYGKTPFAELHMIQKLRAITDPNHPISFPDYAEPLAIDAMKKCLQRESELRPPIVGPNGLLNEHAFLVGQISRK